MKLRWLHEAVAEYEDILADAERRDPLERVNIRRQVFSTLATIRIFRGTGYYNSEAECYEKYVPRTRVILIYKVKDKELVIIAVFHTSRNPKTKPLKRSDTL